MIACNEPCGSWRPFVIAVLTAGSLTLAGAAVAKAQAPAQGIPAPQTTGDEAAIRATAAEFEQAFNAGNASGVAAAWIEDGELVDELGRSFKGREAIEQQFETVFTEQPDANIEVAIESIKFLSPDVAIEAGTTRGRPKQGPAGPPRKYTAVHVKRDGKWQLSNVNESRPATETPNEHRLAGLSWLVGEWQATLEDGKVYRLRCEWLPGKSFLSRSFTISKGDDVASGTQIIGFDPVIGQIVSWTFDSSGGFGHELWEDHGARWRCDASSVLPDGSTGLATNYLTKIDDNAFTWQSVERTQNGQRLPDTAEVRVERISE